MPVRRDDAFSGHTGIALYHASRSNCSARVRLLLEEKGLAWESRPISLQLKENRTAAYFAINPKGLVPSLIIDDLVVTESNDILLHLERQFPEPRFMPDAPSEQEGTRRWMRLSAEVHLPGIKTLNYAMNPPRMSASLEEAASYADLQSDAELVDFHDKARGGFSREDKDRATAVLDEALRAMDTVLADQEGLASDGYGLADICWAPTIPTLRGSGYDLTRFPQVVAWHERIASRPTYRSAVAAWRNSPSAVGA